VSDLERLIFAQVFTTQFLSGSASDAYSHALAAVEAFRQLSVSRKDGLVKEVGR
jgi:hypothetical protein